MKIINSLDEALEDFTIYDNYIEKSHISDQMIEYLIFGYNNHYYALSYVAYFVIYEIAEPSRTAYQKGPCSLYTKKGIIEYLRKIKK